MAYMGADFRNRLKDGTPVFEDPYGVWVDGIPGVIGDDGEFYPDEDQGPEDPRDEWTFVRDQAL